MQDHFALIWNEPIRLEYPSWFDGKVFVGWQDSASCSSTHQVIVNDWFDWFDNQLSPDLAIDQVTMYSPDSCLIDFGQVLEAGARGVPSSLFQHRTIQYSK